MQEHDWESFVDTLLTDDDTIRTHAQDVQSPLSMVCEMLPAYYCKPLINLPPPHLVQNVHPAHYQQPLLYHTSPLPPPAPTQPDPPLLLPSLPLPLPPPPNDRVAALKEEAKAKIVATTQRKTKRCNKEKLDRVGRVIVKCRYGTKCRFIHQGDNVRARTPTHVIERMVDRELNRMLASMATK